ncbi:MAG: alpha/beta fold hydrolase [Prosthecobacter sp.]
MKRLLRWLIYSALMITALGFAAGFANRVPKLPVPPEITHRTEKLMLQGEAVLVDFFLPHGVEKAPVAIVAHGFSRHRRVMTGWGHLLAKNGMIAVVPNLPAFADQGVNIRAIRQLIAIVHEAGRLMNPSPSGDVALIGHSAGGFDTLIAASREERVRCWIGLDPVDFNDHGLRAVKQLRAPGLMLLAESGAWNRYANALAWLEPPEARMTALRIRGSTHCDPENPTSLLAQIVCGDTDAARRAVYERLALAMLRRHLFDDASVAAALNDATDDSFVVLRKSSTDAKDE